MDRLDLDVRAGEIVGLVGANGAGKTTTVECIQGLLLPLVPARAIPTGQSLVFDVDPP